MADDETGSIPDRIPEVDDHAVPTGKVVVVDINPLLCGGILLAVDELVAGHPDVALKVLTSLRLGLELYNRARAQENLETVKRIALAIEGEWP